MKIDSGEKLKIACKHCAGVGYIEKIIYKCIRCGNPYTEYGLREKRYCSLTCARRDTATKSQRETREKINYEKLERIKLAIPLLGDKPDGVWWKDYVAKYAGVSKSFITRMINDGKLQSPVSPKATASE